MTVEKSVFITGAGSGMGREGGCSCWIDRLKGISPELVRGRIVKALPRIGAAGDGGSR